MLPRSHRSRTNRTLTFQKATDGGSSGTVGFGFGPVRNVEFVFIQAGLGIRVLVKELSLRLG
jgi:hypothetical protein